MTLDKPLPGCKGHVKQLLRTNDKTLMKTAFPVATCQLCLHELTSVSSFALAISFSLTCTTRYTSLRISLLQDITSLRRNSATRNSVPSVFAWLQFTRIIYIHEGGGAWAETSGGAKPKTKDTVLALTCTSLTH